MLVAYIGVHFAVGIATGLPGFDSLFGYGMFCHSFSTSVGVKNEWKYTATAPYTHVTYTGTRLLGDFRLPSRSG